MKIRLWEETIGELATNGLTWDDVEEIWLDDDKTWTLSVEMCSITKENFRRIAEDTVYDCGYGGTEINTGLHMSGHSKDGTPFIMFRNEYDGTEWWEVHFLRTGLPIKEVSSLGNHPFDENIFSER